MSCFKGDDRVDAAAICVNGLNVLGKLLNDDRFYLTGSKPVIADFVLFEHINFACHMTDQVFDYYPKLRAFHERMMSNPNLKKYLAGPHHAKVANNWIPPKAKLQINDDVKVTIPGKLSYFDLDGRAGSIRMLLGHGNIKYTD